MRNKFSAESVAVHVYVKSYVITGAWVNILQLAVLKANFLREIDCGYIMPRVHESKRTESKKILSSSIMEVIKAIIVIKFPKSLYTSMSTFGSFLIFSYRKLIP